MCGVSENYYHILKASCIFNQVPEDKYANVLSCLEAKTAAYSQDATVVSAGDNNNPAGIVLSGTLEVYLYDENGNQVIVHHLKEGNVFGAATSCAGQLPSQIYLRAASDCQVLLLNFGVLLSEKTLTCPCRMQVTANLMQEFARRVVFLNTRIRILSQKKLRDKLKIYLQTLRISPSGVITLPFNRSNLAEFLYVDRSALSRELCRLRDEGIILFSGSKITLLKREFLTK